MTLCVTLYGLERSAVGRCNEKPQESAVNWLSVDGGTSLVFFTVTLPLPAYSTRFCGLLQRSDPAKFLSFFCVMNTEICYNFNIC